jgi:hypothetical protein
MQTSGFYAGSILALRGRVNSSEFEVDPVRGAPAPALQIRMRLVPSCHEQDLI